MGDIQAFAPLYAFLQHLEKLLFLLRLKYRDLFGIILLGQHQHEAVIVQKQVKILDISRILYHIAIVVIFKTADAVDVDARYPAVAEQTFLVIHAVSVKQLNGVIRILAPLHDGDLLFHILVHPGLHAADQFLCQRKAAVGFNIIAFSEGKIHGNLLDLFHSHHIVKCLQHQEGSAPVVRLDSRLIPACVELQPAVKFHFFMKLPELSVYPHQQNVVLVLRLIFLRNLQVRRPVRIFFCYITDCY